MNLHCISDFFSSFVYLIYLLSLIFIELYGFKSVCGFVVLMNYGFLFLKETKFNY